MSNLKLSDLKRLRDIFAIASCVSGLAIALSYTGIFQSLELSVLDRWFRLRPKEAKEERIVVVTIGEKDINRLGQWPISDDTLSQLIAKIKQQKPRAIGLDLYRDLPVSPGTEQLAETFRSTPNLIGIEKAIGTQVKPPPILKQQEQVALSDLIVDRDSKVRRGLLSIQLTNGRVQLGLATRLALMYLAAEGIELEAVGDTDKRSLGKAVFTPFNGNDGGYVNADRGGFQILLNFRGTKNSFSHVSITDVLKGNIPKDLMRDRLVLIGSTAPSLNDLFATSYSDGSDREQYIPGVFIHANLASQILSAALDGRSAIEVVSEPGEWLWVFIWTSAASGISFFVLSLSSVEKNSLSLVKSSALCTFLPGIVLLGSGYLLFLQGWWLPVITPLCSLLFSTTIISTYYNQIQKQLAYIDGLTQIPNRRFFNRVLQQKWDESQKKQQSLSVILCDVDHFKKYNDTYGHQAGDECLQQVAKVISQTVRSHDFAARYGGEEFVVILPNTEAKAAAIVAQRLCVRLKASQIPHSSSLVSPYVSLSCGVAGTDVNTIAYPDNLVEFADLALYQAKEQGRDRAVIAA